MSEIVEFNHLPELAKAIHDAMGKHVEEVAIAIAESADNSAPVRTGHLASSGYVVTHSGSTYGQGSTGGELLPEVDRPGDDQSAIAAMAATYAIDVNYGTVNMAAEPFWEPAIDDSRRLLENPRIEERLAAVK